LNTQFKEKYHMISNDFNKQKSWRQPALGLLAAIAVITAIFASGLPAELGALSLIPLVGLFWYLGRFSRAEMGFVQGRGRYYSFGLLQPAFVFGPVALAAWMAGAIHIQNSDWPKTLFNLATTIPITILLAVITEEGFFRGWLWAALQRAGLSRVWIVILTSLAIAAWHLPVALLSTEFDLSPAQALMYVSNVTITGIIMGVLRLVSGSVVVPSISHGIWNGILYPLFGAGTQIGFLGIQDSTFHPEVGVLGLVLNIVLAIGLWLWYWRADGKRAANQGLHPEPGAQSKLDNVPLP
jgi:membrane protease YdiL (CAAX protease family)